MKEHPILFRAEMVKAILDGRKTVTRRVVKLRDPSWTYSVIDDTLGYLWPFDADEGGQWHKARCPYGVPGDRLWVRETWCPVNDREVAYRADNGRYVPQPEYPPKLAELWNKLQPVGRHSAQRWFPSIHMPRWASRIELELLDVRVERVQEITEEDAEAEGVDFIPSAPASLTHRGAFAKLWDKLNGKRGFSWESNPWVWRLEFRRVKP